MGFVSVVEACAIPLGLFTVIWLAYRHDQRKQARVRRLHQLWAEQQAARYFELEFLVAPPPFDWQADVDWQDAA